MCVARLARAAVDANGWTAAVTVDAVRRERSRALPEMGPVGTREPSTRRGEGEDKRTGGA
jgi:hypothetical protein